MPERGLFHYMDGTGVVSFLISFETIYSTFSRPPRKQNYLLSLRHKLKPQKGVSYFVPERGLFHYMDGTGVVSFLISFETIYSTFSRPPRKQNYLLSLRHKLKPQKGVSYFVPERGLEPPHCCQYSILSRVRLPFRHSGICYYLCCHAGLDPGSSSTYFYFLDSGSSPE